MHGGIHGSCGGTCSCNKAASYRLPLGRRLSAPRDAVTRWAEKMLYIKLDMARAGRGPVASNFLEFLFLLFLFLPLLCFSASFLLSFGFIVAVDLAFLLAERLAEREGVNPGATDKGPSSAE